MYLHFSQYHTSLETLQTFPSLNSPPFRNSPVSSNFLFLETLPTLLPLPTLLKLKSVQKIREEPNLVDAIDVIRQTVVAQGEDVVVVRHVL